MKGLKVRASHQDSLGYELAVFFFFLCYFVCYCYQSAEYSMKLVEGLRIVLSAL